MPKIITIQAESSARYSNSKMISNNYLSISYGMKYANIVILRIFIEKDLTYELKMLQEGKTKGGPKI